MSGASRRILAGVAAAALAGCAAIAPKPSHQFLERTYVARVPSDTSIMYEAQAVTHILLVDGLPDAYDKLSQSAYAPNSASAWRFIATPMFRIRQLNDSSSAVRTPSFMPRVSLEHLTATRRRVRRRAPVMTYDAADVLGVRLTLAHHSNGQAGCFRENFVPLDARSNVCVPKAGADTTVVRLNRANGDFSSTFLNGMVHYTWMGLDGSQHARYSLGAAVGGDWHVPGLFGALSDEQRSLYGSLRGHTQIEGMTVVLPHCADAGTSFGDRVRCLPAGRLRVTSEYEHAYDFPGDLSKRIVPAVTPWRGSIEISHSMNALLGAGWFVRWHRGQDYYNIGFVNRRDVFMYGVMLDLSGLDRVGAKIVQ